MDAKEISREIEKLECGDTTYGACEKLSILYTVRDHLDDPQPVRQDYSFAPAAERPPQTEFEEAAASIDWDSLMDVLNEHFEVIKALHPKEYAAVLKRLKNKGLE